MMKLSELKPAAYNPRTISAQAFTGLKFSLAEFGDISGIVFNRTTGNLVAGHQRVKALHEQYGDLNFNGDGIVTPNGERFAVRFVEWPLAKERAANVAANAPTIAGEFTAELAGVLSEIKIESPRAFDAMQFQDVEFPQFDEVVEVYPETKTLESYKRVHILISVPPDYFDSIKTHLEKIKATANVEYEQSEN